jgi:hypothetical protein
MDHEEVGRHWEENSEARTRLARRLRHLQGRPVGLKRRDAILWGDILQGGVGEVGPASEGGV